MEWPAWLCRIVPCLGRRRAEEDLEEELRLHLEMEAERNRNAGLPEEDAHRAARRRLGNAALIRERTRDVWGWGWLDDFARDAHHAVRGLRRSPGFAAAVVLVLALGIGGARPSNGSASGRTSGDAAQIRVRTISLLEEMVGTYRPALAALASATALILLIACVNVAGLLLARGVNRQRALAVCAALGAGRGRIVRQLLAESMILSLGGGVLGLAAANLLLRAVPALVPGDVVRLDEVNVDGLVLAFTLGLSAVVGLVFGAAPALQWSGRRLLRTLVEGSARSTGGFGLLGRGGSRCDVEPAAHR